jgi:hypothetical protein
MVQDSLNRFLSSPYVLAIFFVSLWCCFCFLFSILSGWHSLSKRFRSEAKPYGDIRSAGPFFYTVYVRFWGHYSSVIRMTAATDALYLSIRFPFRIGHPPLCIPWKEIKFGRTKFLMLRYVALTLGEQERIPIRISNRMARNLGILDRVSDQAFF